MDGELERYSRGFDTWVPLDSDASFAAMKRSIDVQRKSGGNHRARVLLRIKSPIKTEPEQQRSLSADFHLPSLSNLALVSLLNQGSKGKPL